MPNEFSVQPLGGFDIVGAGRRLGAAYTGHKARQSRQEKLQEASALMASGDTEAMARFMVENPELRDALQGGYDFMQGGAAKTAQQESTDKAAELFKNEDYAGLAEHMIKNPELQKSVTGAQKFANDSTKENRLKSIRRVLSGEDHRIVAQENADFITSQGGDPSETLAFMEMTPEEAKKIARGELAYLDPNASKAYEAIQGREGGDQTVRIQEFEKWKAMPDGEEKDALGRIIGATSRQESVEDYIARQKAKADVELEKAESMNAILAKRKRGEKLSIQQTDRLEGYISKGLDAYDRLPQVDRGLELLEKVRTGGLTAKSKAITDFFGTTSGDIAELNRILAGNVLAGLSNFTGAISEGERAFLERMETNLAAGGDFNKREMHRMQRELKKQIGRARSAAKITGDEFALEVLSGGVKVKPIGDQGAGQDAPLDNAPSGYAERRARLLGGQ